MKKKQTLTVTKNGTTSTVNGAVEFNIHNVHVSIGWHEYDVIYCEAKEDGKTIAETFINFKPIQYTLRETVKKKIRLLYSMPEVLTLGGMSV